MIGKGTAIAAGLLVLAGGAIVVTQRTMLRGKRPAGAPVTFAPRAPEAGPGNALVVVWDDVGADDVADLEAKLDALGLPCAIKALADGGVTFAKAYGAPVCSPSRWSLQGGTWHFNECGIGCDPMPGAELGSGLETLAELAERAGVPHRGFFGKWHLGGAPSGGSYLQAPYEHGYTYADWTPGNMNAPGGAEGSCGGTGYTSWFFVPDGTDPARAGLTTLYNPSMILGRLLAWRDTLTGSSESHLAVWNVSLPHAPFHTVPSSARPPGYPAIVISDHDRYMQMLATADYELGLFLAGIDLSDWLVIVVGDNGTPQQVAPDPSRAKTTTFERGVRVPFVLAGAGLTHYDSPRLVQLVDVAPTLAEYWGVAPAAGIDGLSVVGGPVHPYVLTGQSGGWFGGNPIVPGDWAAIGFGASGYWSLRRHGLPSLPVAEELYDLALDPEQMNPLDPSTKPVLSQYLRSKLLAEGVP